MAKSASSLTRSELWVLTHVERASLAADLETLTADQWAVPSLCGDWTVQQVVAHLTAAAGLGPLRWMRSVIGARFDFDLHNNRRLNEQLGPTAAATLARFRQIQTSTTATFGPTEAWLGEVVVHAADIRRPLGLAMTPTVAAVTPVAEHFARSDFTVNSRTMITGLRLEATDGPFATGQGPLLTGSTLALAMIMAGRAAFVDDLEGDGIDIVQARFAH